MCIADRPGPALDQLADTFMIHPTDVRRVEDLEAMRAAVLDRFGKVDVLMNNAAVQPGSDMFGPADFWIRVIETNLWGIIHGTQVFAPGMIAAGRPALIINTGSKQGITTPPGDPAYNVAKAGVKAFTEALQHTLRTTEGCHVTRPSPHTGLRLHAPDCQRPCREARGRVDPRTDGRVHAYGSRGRRLLHSLP